MLGSILFINKFIYPEEVDNYIQQGFKLGRYLSPEALQKMSQKGENHPMYNKHPSEETRQKISMTLTGKSLSEEKIANEYSRDNASKVGK